MSGMDVIEWIVIAECIGGLGMCIWVWAAWCGKGQKENDMRKRKSQLKPNIGPVYAAAVYPGLCKICRRHGYALAVRGSLARVFDLIAVPWGAKVSSREVVIEDITSEYAIRQCGEPEEKRHGRVGYTLSIGHGDCLVDMSFMRVEQWLG